MIINISNPAKEELNNMFKEYNINNKYLRVYIRELSAWYGPIFSIALDEPTENDKVFESDDFKIVINKELCDKISVINIYYKSAISSDIFRVSTDLLWKEEYYEAPWAKPW